MDCEGAFPAELQSHVFKILSSNETKAMEVILSPSEAQVSHALLFLQCSKKFFPDLLLLKLFFLARCGPHLQTRANALRLLLSLPLPLLWAPLKPDARSSLKAHFLAFLSSEKSTLLLSLFCSLLSHLLSLLYSNNDHWPDLLHFLVASVDKKDNDNINKKHIIVLLVLAKFPREHRMVICEGFKDVVKDVSLLILEGLEHNDNDNDNDNNNDDDSLVKVASMGAFVTLLPLFAERSNDDGGGVCVFHEVLRRMMVGVFSLLMRSSEESSVVNVAFKELVCLVSDGPTQLLKMCVGDVVLNMLRIAENSGFNVEIHCHALRVVVGLTERKDFKPLFLDLPNETMVRLFLVPLKMLLCIGEDTTVDGSVDESSNEKTNVYKFGLVSLYQISVTLGESKLVPIASEVLMPYLESSEWQKRHAGLTLLALVAQEFSFEMLDFMDDSLGMIVLAKIMNLFQDSQFEVRLAAFNFMAMPTIFVQMLHLYYHSRLLPAFVWAHDTEPNSKVKEQVASAMLYFLKNTLPDSLSFSKNLDTLMSTLLVSLQDDVTPSHKSILLSTFNIVAERCSTVALNYYVNYIPILLEACNDKNSEVKEEATRGIRICAESGSQQYKPFIKGIISKLNILIQNPNQPVLEKAKVKDIAVSALGRICICYRDCVDTSKLVPVWLSLLPLRADLNEAKIMHEQLCLMVSRSDMDLLGPRNQNLMKIIAVFAEVIDKGNELATPETVKMMSHFLREFGRAIPRSSWDLMLLSMNSEQQQVLLSMVSPSKDYSS